MENVMSMDSTAIILASGVGKRMGAGMNKVLLPVCEKPILCWAVEAFSRCAEVWRIVLVVRTEERELFRDVARRWSLRVTDIVPGGETRQESAHNAITYLEQHAPPSGGDVVLFHNAANPFVTGDEIIRCTAEARTHGASVVAHPVKDTIKEVGDDGMVTRTLERKRLWAMQTPQAMTFSVAQEAFRRASRDGFIGTDDVSLVERIGGTVKVIEASPRNVKITTPLDLETAHRIAEAKQVA